MFIAVTELFSELRCRKRFFIS